MTLLGRGFGADVVLALTTAPRAKGLFHQVWATNGAGAFANNTLDQVNSENKVSRSFKISNYKLQSLILFQYVLDELTCAADEVRCLAKAEANEIANSIPDSWIDGRQPDLPIDGEKR